MEVTSIDIERKDSFAHLMPSETYIKAFYKLRELEVALVSACLTTDQVNLFVAPQCSPVAIDVSSQRCCIRQQQKAKFVKAMLETVRTTGTPGAYLGMYQRC